MSLRGVLGIAIAVLMAAAVAGGLLLVGSPGETRAGRLDERRVEHLRQIAGWIDLYWTREGRLPASLEALNDVVGAARVPADPDTGEAYAYHASGEQRYQLCAVFLRASAEVPDKLFTHAAGRQCFELEARDLREGRRRRPAG